MFAAIAPLAGGALGRAAVLPGGGLAVAGPAAGAGP
jgi:hypothetical protein